MENIKGENAKQPGVSGKNEVGRSWFNTDKYHEQRDQIEEMDEAEKGFAQSTGKNLMGRTDLTNQGEEAEGTLEEKTIFEALKRGPMVDVADVHVKVVNHVVTLEGTAINAKEARAMINIVENVEGVKEVINNLSIIEGSEF